MSSAENDPRKQSITCGECGKSFCSSSSLTHHKKIHKGQAQLTECEMNVRIDIFFSDGDERYTHKCDVCGKKFSDNSNLKKHREIHGIFY